METRHLEIERFSRKASEYKLALRVAPEAREIELRAVAAMVLGICETRGWSTEKVRIVDLMAGSGALSGMLERLGCKSISAVEACLEMQGPDTGGVEFLGADAFANLRAELDLLRPQIIVSLAGFHHLIERRGTRIDRTKSLLSQVRIADACLESLVQGGVLLIVDLVQDDGYVQLKLPTIGRWSGSAFEGVPLFSRELASSLSECRALSSYEHALDAWFPNRSRSCSLRWFREYVDRWTVIGHDDVAISADILEMLQLKWPGRIRFQRFTCPWIFESWAHAREFVLHKFGFYVDQSPAQVDEEKVFQAAKKCLSSVDAAEGEHPCALGWDLGAIMISSTDVSGEQLGRVAVLCLLLLLGVLAVGMSSAKHFGWTGLEAIMGGILWIDVGMAVTVLVDLFRTRFT